MNKFSKDLAGDMYDASIRFSEIIHIPTLDAVSPTDQIERFSEDYLDGDRNTLSSTWDKFSKYLDSDEELPKDTWEVAEILLDYCDKEFIFHIDIAIPHAFHFNEKGQFSSCSSGFGYYRQIYIFANSTTEAAEFGIAYAEKMHQEYENKARVEQSIQECE